MSAAKDSLMNSLMGGGAPEQDLFGDVPDVALPTHDPAAAAAVPPPSLGASLPPAPPPSILSASGLLGTNGLMNGGGGGGGGGLFDAIDEEEEKKKQEEEVREAALRKQQEEAEAQRKQLEEQSRLLEQQRQQQLLEQQQQQMQDQMQSIHLGPPPAPNATYMNQSMVMPQGQQPGVNNMMGSQMQGSYMQPQQQPSMMQGSFVQQQPTIHSQQPTYTTPSQPPVMQQPQQQQHHMQQQQPMMQQSSMMQQSVMQQQQQPAMQQSQNGFYRDHNQQQQQPPSNGSRFYQAPLQGSVTAGMHGVGGRGGPAAAMLLPQQGPPPQYSKVTVMEPLLLGSPTILGIGQPPHWSYHVATELRDGTVLAVRRRFRHVVALEDRLREEIPGAVLPPRPDKHATRAIEEASAHQSAEFAVQRAAELQFYLNQMIQHPYASSSVTVRLFLSLQDDLGIAWPEVSNNALTRLANASVGAAVKVSETTSNMQTDAGEDNAELLALQNAESIRMGAVLQAVPKLEGAVTLLREQSELMLSVGMEFSRVAKEVAEAQPMDIASAGLLRAGRRSKRMVMELSAAMQSYSHHHKLCRYERMAFSDRRAAITRRHKERHRADQRASQLMMHQRQQHLMNASMMDGMANDAGQECEEVGQRLKSEIHRIASSRRAEWSASVKIVASAMKEALSERVAIWETVEESFLQSFPEYKAPPQEQPPSST